MIPGEFDYQRATSLDDAIARITASGGEGKFLVQLAGRSVKGVTLLLELRP